MMVFPLIRSVGLKAATASSRVATVPMLVETLTRLRELGVLTEDADAQRLGTGLLAALQGGYLLAQNAHSSKPMAVALDMALDHIESFARN